MAGPPICPTHQGEELKLFCESCDEVICRDCTVEDHPKPEHDFKFISTAAPKQKAALADMLTAAAGKVVVVKGGISAIEGVLLAVAQCKVAVAAEITAKYETLAQVSIDIYVLFKIVFGIFFQFVKHSADFP